MLAPALPDVARHHDGDYQHGTVRGRHGGPQNPDKDQHGNPIGQESAGEGGQHHSRVVHFADANDGGQAQQLRAQPDHQRPDAGVVTAAAGNAGRASFHGGQLTFRRAVSQGWGFDFNYTLSHSIDLASTAESAAGVGGGVIQDSFNPTSFRGSSDFDIRHNITANGVVELPFGKGKPMLGSAPGWLNQIVGGWQASTLWRFRTGNPLNVTNGGIYPTNYLNSALGQLRPGASLPENTAGYNANGNPSIFRTTNAATDANTSLANPSTFGQFTAVMAPRVIQFALRYEF